MKVIEHLYEEFKVSRRKVRLVGVRAFRLACVDDRDLFGDPSEERKESVHQAVAKIRRKFGMASIGRASSAF